mmetsp:Transcript_15518/g.31421  ORF Transcript_15518/g.31421 Transcript_15518/m.31421 type:complete len:910 (+) Transcript_15518:36-2765(+)
MALRAFQSNPAIGGFGGEGGSQLDYINTQENNDRATKKATQIKEQSTSAGTTQHASASSHLGGESCDAFAQIVKELVDNAVDACARENNNDIGKENERNAASASPVSSKRVRVEIKPTQISISDDDENDDDDATKTMECLRVKVSDNGCGMEDIDACVSAFRSTKNGVDTDSIDKQSSSQQQQSRGKQKTNGKQSKSKSKKKQDTGSSANNKHASSSLSSSSYTSGRYGVGLTLCLLHAQRLVPNSVTLIVTSTKSSDYWTIRRYRADTDKDEIVCLKEERLPKIDKEECGTIVEVLVPGGQGATSAWPRLAEYFARFQLSIDLPCSIEVKAETLQPLPLYVRPPKEMQRRIHRKGMKPLAVDVLMNSTKNNDVDDDIVEMSDNDDGGDWDDGFDEGNAEEEGENSIELQRVSKSSRERARLEDEKKRKVALMQRAASLYKGRVDLRETNVAYSTQRIRQKNEGGKSASNAAHGPILEMSMVVFGTRTTASTDDSVHSGNDTCCNKTAKLQVVRMVNGIPVLDSSEALACGVMTKISRSTALWNSFGLEISDRSQLTSSSPSFGINDSAQVAPFLRTSAHSLYSGQDDALSSSDDDDFDLEDIHNKRKRKKEQQARCILPAAQRLGDVLILVQIRAKPSALPLPTLSKGRLPMNDKGINDALENAVSDCLRSLQVKNPRLLLTAHQLKKIERDVKYAPLVAGALASVLSRSKKQGLYQNSFTVASRWDDQVKNLGASLDGTSIGQERRERAQTAASADDERAKSLALGPIIERRIRFVVSDEFKAHQKAEEMEYKRQQREEMAAERKRAKESKAADSDGLNSDAFCSDEDSVCKIANDENSSARNVSITKDHSEGDGLLGDGFQSDSSSSTSDGYVEPEPIVHKEKDEVADDDSWSSEFGECIDGALFR